MRRTLRIVLILAMLCTITSAISEVQEISEKKVKYSPSEADIFMMTLDDAMKEELVREILTESDEVLLAKMLYGEDRENPTYMRAAVIWCVYNRMDANKKPISENVNQAIFPGYMPGNPVKQWAIDIVRDVTIRYLLEQNGFTDVGRVLPKEYMWYEQLEGHRDHVFKTTIKISDPECKRWDWSLPSPYKDN